MRVLIITHERSGGHNMLAWLAEELGIQEILHEPLKSEGSGEVEDWKKILHHPHLIAKSRFFMMKKKGKIEELAAAFPFVFCLTRSDTRASAVSYVHTLELGNSHIPYENNPQWEKNHEEEIQKHKERFDAEVREIRKLPHLQITYEQFYSKDPVQISTLLNYLHVQNPRFLSKYLDPAKRLRQKSKGDKTFKGTLQNNEPMPIFHRITTSLLSEKSFFIGDISTDEEIRIDGKYRGKITSTNKVIVWLNGEFEGDIVCQDADILGKITGTIEASSLILLRKNCVVEGSLKSGQVQMEAGSVFNGECQIIPEPKKVPKNLDEERQLGTKDDLEPKKLIRKSHINT